MVMHGKELPGKSLKVLLEVLPSSLSLRYMYFQGAETESLHNYFAFFIWHLNGR